MDYVLSFQIEQEGGSLITPMALYIISIPLEAGQWISMETCGLDGFPTDDLSSSLYTQFIMI